MKPNPFVIKADKAEEFIEEVNKTYDENFIKECKRIREKYFRKNKRK